MGFRWHLEFITSAPQAVRFESENHFGASPRDRLVIVSFCEEMKAGVVK